MAYENTHLIKSDVLFRGGEPINGSQYDGKVLDYINRIYSGIASGASEFVPEFVDDWWWLRARGSLLLLPSVAGTVTLTQNSTAAEFAQAPTISLAGYKLRIASCPDIYTIAAHNAGEVNFTLDLAFSCLDVISEYVAMKTDYSLNEAVAAITGPITLYRAPFRINGLSPESMDDKYPMANLSEGSPTHFSLDSETAIRMSHGGRSDGISMRADYRYRPVVTTLTDSVNSIPLVPQQWRHILADMALVMLYIDKNDDRSSAIALAARSALAGMIKENRRRFTKMDRALGHIYPRLGQVLPRGLPIE